MKELYDIAFSSVNIVLTILSLVMLFYWLLTIFTGFELDLLDVEFDVDVDADTDMDLDTDNSEVEVDLPNQTTGAEAATESAGMQFLRFFNFDELPIMLMLTIIFFCMWFISVNVTHYLGLSESAIGFLLLIPNLIVSLFVAKLIAVPIGKLYKIVNPKGEEAIDFLGRTCKVITSVKEDKIGQVEVMVNGDPIRIYAKGNKGAHITEGNEAVIVNESKDKKYYIIEKFNTIN